MTPISVPLDRRQLLTRSAGGLSVLILLQSGCVLLPPLPTFRDDPELQAEGWLLLNAPGQVELRVPRTEMGQGIATGFAQIVAIELEMPIDAIDVSFARPHEVEPVRFTVGSDSIERYHAAIQKAARKLRFILDQSKNSGSNAPKINAKAEGSAPFVRIDSRDKCTGQAVFTHDVEVEGQVYGYVFKPNRFGARPLKWSSSRLDPRIEVVTDLERGLLGIACADRWLLLEAIAAFDITWSEETVMADGVVDDVLGLDGLRAKSSPSSLVSSGDKVRVEVIQSRGVDLSFKTAINVHACMETQAAVVRLDEKNQMAEVWIGSQAPWYVLKVAQKLTGYDDVRVYPQFLGGGFGGRVVSTAVVEAIELAKRIRKPVKVLWTREEDLRYGYVRTPSFHRIRAAVDDSGRLSDWHHEFSSGRVIFTNGFPSEFVIWATSFIADPGGSRGAELPYSASRCQVDYWSETLPFPTGAMRGLGAPTNNFAMESAIDELCRQRKLDPLQFRLDNLSKEQQRLRDCLQEVARLAKWKQNESERMLGLAIGNYKNVTFVAVIAELKQDTDKSWRLQHIYLAHDCGMIINRDLVRSQIEGNIIWGISMAFDEQSQVKNGHIAAQNFDNYAVARIERTPAMTISFVNDLDTYRPTGAGEAAMMPVPAAIANAFARALGKRFAELPLPL